MELRRVTTVDELMKAVYESGLYDPAPGMWWQNVNSINWTMDPKKVSSWFFDGGSSFGGIRRQDDGSAIIDMGTKYRIYEPFDLQISSQGFVLWSCSTATVRSMSETTTSRPTGEPKTHRDFTPITVTTTRHVGAEVKLVSSAGPICGVAAYGEFPLDESGWRPAEEWTMR